MQLDDGLHKLDLREFSDLDPGKPLINLDIGLVRICLITQDLKSEVARLKAQGVEFTSQIKPGYNQLADIAVCKNPDGTLIELLQVYLERWQSILKPE